MSLYLAQGGPELEISPAELRSLLFEALGKLGERHHVLAVPPDLTRRESCAGELTQWAYEYYGGRLKAVLPALGTHAAMSPAQLTAMFGNLPHALFRIHNWRRDCDTIGEVPASFIDEQSEGKLNYAWPVQVNRLIVGDGFDLVLSLGQVVPHEVAGMANYNKNILIGTGGYRGTPATLACVKGNAELANELGAAAHLIHGSSEGRFSITWCPAGLTRAEVEGVGFAYADLRAMLSRYDPAKLRHGYNTVDGEEIFFIANPGLGLWAYRGRFSNQEMGVVVD